MLKFWRRIRLLTSTGLALLILASAAWAEESKEFFDKVGPTDPGLAKLLGLHTQKGLFYLLDDDKASIASLSKPKHFRVCILSGSETAKVVFETSYLVTDDTMIVMPAGAPPAKDQKVFKDEKSIMIEATRCADVEGQKITVMPVNTLGGQQRIRGTYEPVN